MRLFVYGIAFAVWTWAVYQLGGYVTMVQLSEELDSITRSFEGLQ